MAGDWLKMRGNLWDDPRVGRLCDLTDSTEGPVIGALYWLWATADQHTEDGFLPGLTLRQIDRKTALPGFGAALCEIGWLQDGADGVTLIRFQEHNGSSAKRRCTDAQRKASVRVVSASDADKQQTHTGQKQDEMREPAELEKRREEKSNTSSPLRSEESPAKPEKSAKAKPEPSPDDVAPQVWADWLALRKAKKAPVTATVIASARAEAIKAGLTFDAFLIVWCARGSQGLQADWLKPHERGSPQQPTETAWQRSQRERVEEATGGLLSTRRHTKPVEFTDADCTPATVPLALG